MDERATRDRQAPSLRLFCEAFGPGVLAKDGRDAPVKRTVALAMSPVVLSAVAEGLKPWNEYAR